MAKINTSGDGSRQLGFVSQTSCSTHLPSSPPPLRSGARPPGHPRNFCGSVLILVPQTDLNLRQNRMAVT